MLLQKTNIEDELSRLKSKGFDSKYALQQVYDILNAHQDNQERIQGNLQKRKKVGINNFVFDLLETDKIYHIDQIKKICIDYRLRFLSSKYFKGDIPQEAYATISALEKRTLTKSINQKYLHVKIQTDRTF